jgi:iron complex outermembrane receptor protein
MNRFYRVLLLLSTPSALFAQSAVQGTVLDRHSAAPIAHALVAATGAPSGTTTDDAGRFRLMSSKPITSVTVAAVGYATRTIAVTDAATPLRIELTPSQTELPGVQVIAEVPTPSTAVVTKNDLNRFSGLALSDAINTVPGVFMQSRTPFGGARITIRGYYPSTSGNSPNSNGLGYNTFLNNIPITDATGTTVLDDVDFATLGSVEVIKGPASSVYGGAIGGTVRMITARPTSNETSASQQFLSGSNGLMRTNTTLQGANGVSDYVLNYGYQGDDSFRPHSRSRKAYVRANGDYTVGTNQTLSALFAFNRSYEELAGEIDSADFYNRRPVSDANYLANNSHIQLTSFLTGITDNQRFGEHFSNQTSVFASGRFSNQPFAHGFTDATQFNFGARTSFGYTARVGDVNVDGTLGAMIQRSNITSNGVFIIPAPPYVERPSATQNVAENSYYFTEWKFALPSQVKVTAGGTLISNAFGIQNMLKSGQLFDTTAVLTKKFATVFAPRLEVAKAFHDDATIYASISTGYTPPLLSQSLSSDNSINTGLKPEQATQLELGVQGTIAQRLTGQFAVFQLDNTNKLISQTINTVTSTTNVGHQRNQGAELSLSWLAISDTSSLLSKVRPWLSYTYTDAKYVDFKSDNNGTAATVNFSGNSVARVPKTMYALGIDVATNNGISLTSTYQFVDRVPVTFDNSTFVRSYSLLGAKVAYKVKLTDDWMLNLAAGGDNLLGSTYYNFLFVGPNYKGLAQGPDGGNGDGYILPGTYAARYYLSAGVSYVIR